MSQTLQPFPQPQSGGLRVAGAWAVQGVGHRAAKQEGAGSRAGQTAAEAGLPSIAQSLHGGKAPAVEPGRQRLAAPGTCQALLGPSALPGSSRSGNPICSDLTDEKKIKATVAPSKVEAAPPELRPRQLDPPKTGSLLSAAFYRTIKPEVQVRSLRPVIFQKGVRLHLQDSSCLARLLAATSSQTQENPDIPPTCMVTLPGLF